jgi:hypothetical protein
MRRGLVEIERHALRNTVRTLVSEGWSVFHLPQGAVDRGTFFAAARAALPLDPPVVRDNWDGLTDSLFEGLSTQDNHRLAIVWEDADQMRSDAPEDFSVACESLSDVVDGLADPRATLGSPRDLLVLISA